MLTKEHILEALRTVIDPELHHNIVDLGLVYGVEIKSEAATGSHPVDGQQGVTLSHVVIDLTLTTPACPLAPYIVSRINEALVNIPGVTDVAVNLVFDPPWTLERIEANLRLELFPNWIPPHPSS